MDFGVSVYLKKVYGISLSAVAVLPVQLVGFAAPRVGFFCPIAARNASLNYYRGIWTRRWVAFAWQVASGVHMQRDEQLRNLAPNWLGE